MTEVEELIRRVLRESVEMSDDAQHVSAYQFISNRDDRIAAAIVKRALTVSPEKLELAARDVRIEMRRQRSARVATDLYEDIARAAAIALGMKCEG